MPERIILLKKRKKSHPFSDNKVIICMVLADKINNSIMCEKNGFNYSFREERVMSVAVKGGFGGYAGSAAAVTVKSGSAGKAGAGKKQANKPRKKLNYNPREISSQLMRANKSRNAAAVLARARIRLSLLHQAHASGQYNQNEVRNAMAHAKRMVECCRVKTRNLKEEEILKSRNDRDHNNGEQKKRNEIRRRVRKKEQDLKVKMSLEESQRILKEKTRKQQLIQKRQMHRNDERRRMTEADMKYLEDQLRDNQSDKTVRYEGVTLDLSSQAAQMAELQQLERQIEQEIELEVEMEYAAMESGDASSAALSDGGASLSGMESGGGEAPISLDVSI